MLYGNHRALHIRRNSLMLAFASAIVTVVVAACASGTATPALLSTATSTGSGVTPTSQPGTKQKLLIAVQPTGNPESLRADSQEIEKFLESRVNADVEMLFPTLFAGVIESLRFGHADAAFMSAWPAALAQKHAGATVALAEIREVVIGQEKQEQPYYYSYWVVRKDSPYTKLEDLRGKKVAFSSQLSTSGYVFPLARLIEKGLVDGSAAQPDAKSFFGEVLFAGGYAQAWEALKKGQVDVAIIAGDVSETLYREVLDGTNVIDQQGPIPSHALIFSKDLKEPLRSELQAAFLELGKPENKALMRKFISGIFVRFEPSDNEKHLAGLTSALNTTKLSFTESLR